MPTYHELRRLHFRITLKAWLHGLDKALLAFAGVLPIGILAVLAVFVLVQADALELLVAAGTPTGQRIAVLAGWQAITFILLRALREAVLMPKARAFFAALPVPPSRELRSDVVFALQAYSILWVPLCWVAYRAADSRAIMTLAALGSISLCANLSLLRGRPLHAIAALAALALLALPATLPAFAAPTVAVAIAVIALWRSYLPGSARSRPPSAANGVTRWARKISVNGGLALPFLLHELRSNVLIRLGFIAATFGTCALLTSLRDEGDGGTRTLVFVGAVAAVALYPMPALWRGSLLSKLHFVAGHPAFVKRIRPSVYGIPILLFGAALLLAGHLDAGQSAPVAAWVFSALFAAGVVAARRGIRIASWLMPLVSFVAVLVLGGMM